MGWQRIARVALHRRRVPAEMACNQADDGRASARYSRFLRIQMARANYLRYQRSNTACGNSRELCHYQPGGRQSGSRARCVRAVADVRSDAGNGAKEAGCADATPAEDCQTTRRPPFSEGLSPAPVCLVRWPHVVVSALSLVA